MPEPVLQRVEADEHGIRGQQQMLVTAALCALPGELHRIDEDESRRCPAASAIDGEWFSGEAGHSRPSQASACCMPGSCAPAPKGRLSSAIVLGSFR